MTDIKRARSRIDKKAKHLQEIHRQQQLMLAAQAATPDEEKISPKRKGVGLKGQLKSGSQSGLHGGAGGNKTASSSIDRDMEAFKNIVKDYNRQLNNQNPRDFNADLPIL